MCDNGLPTPSRMVLAICTMILFATNTWAASEKTVHYFGKGVDGAYPWDGLIFDTAGNLYGTTYYGGSHCGSLGCGTVFEMTPNGSGGWTEKVLHNFGITNNDGRYPEAGLIFDAAGNLYGTTGGGGSHGFGTVFEMTPNGSGGWTEKVLHNFSGANGSGPESSLIWDNAGNLYGTTSQGGTHGFSGGAGTVFELMPNGDGGWTEKVLHNFGSGMDGEFPQSALIFDAGGNLYGTTYYGGTHCSPGCGTVFELTPNGSGGWTERVLHNFGSGMDGKYPWAGLIFDAAGNLYGTSSDGGSHTRGGIVFEMTPNGSGGWTEKALHNFGSGTDGAFPQAGLIFDGNGNLYGTTGAGGSLNWGTAFEMTPNGSGGWTEFLLHNFGIGNDGRGPLGGLVFDHAGNLYGTTNGNEPYTQGTVFEITPD